MYPEDKAEITWEEDNLVFSLIHITRDYPPEYELNNEWYCGYVRFPSRPLIATGYNNFATYVPVHGGITFAEEHEDKSMVYGFDCAHLDDIKNPKLDINWLKHECRILALGIKVAVKYEKDYLLAPSQEEKANIIDTYHEEMEKLGVEFDLQDNFGALLKLIGGNL